MTPRILITIVLLLCGAMAQAAWPERPLRLIGPFPPGGPNDVVARLVAEPLGQALGQPVVVENRAGAGGTIGSEQGAKAPADGYTLTLASTSSHSLPTVLGQRIGYSPLESFAPIGLIGSTPIVLLASNAVGSRSFPELLARLRAEPGRLNYGSSGNGTLNHLSMESLKVRTGTFIVHIPYRGTGQAMADLASGQIDLMLDAAITAGPQVKAGRMRALAVGGERRLPDLRDVPTFDELGLKGFQASLWIGLLAPAGTPEAVLQRLANELRAVLQRPDVTARMATLGFAPLPGPATAATALMRDEQRAWSEVVRTQGLKVD